MTKATGVDTGYSLVGVISDPACGFTVPSVYTEVSHYLSWIAEQYGLTFPSTTNPSGRRKFKKTTRKRKNKGRGRRRNRVKKGRGNRRNQVKKGKGRKKVNTRQHSLRWKQRKNKKSEKVGFTKKRQGRSVDQGEARQTGQGCDPIEVSKLVINMDTSLQCKI